MKHRRRETAHNKQQIIEAFRIKHELKQTGAEDKTGASQNIIKPGKKLNRPSHLLKVTSKKYQMENTTDRHTDLGGSTTIRVCRSAVMCLPLAFSMEGKQQI